MEVLNFNNHVEYPKAVDWQYIDYAVTEDFECGAAAVEVLSKRIESELRAAKRTHLSCGEVLLPCGLLQKIAADIMQLADTELCGLRGCTLHVAFEDDADCRRLSTVKCDPSTASTFEVYLTLKQSTAAWNSFLPQFLKKMTRGSTIMISTEYELTKKRLYRSYVVD